MIYIYHQHRQRMQCDAYSAVIAATSSPTPRKAASSSMDSSSHLCMTFERLNICRDTCAAERAVLTMYCQHRSTLPANIPHKSVSDYDRKTDRNTICTGTWAVCHRVSTCSDASRLDSAGQPRFWDANTVAPPSRPNNKQLVYAPDCLAMLRVRP